MCRSGRCGDEQPRLPGLRHLQEGSGDGAASGRCGGILQSRRHHPPPLYGVGCVLLPHRCLADPRLSSSIPEDFKRELLEGPISPDGLFGPHFQSVLGQMQTSQEELERVRKHGSLNRPIPPAVGGIAVISGISRDAPRPLLPEFLRPLLRLLSRRSSAEVGSWRAPGPTLRRSHGGDLKSDWWGGGCV
ncbi:hypothetical protein CHARACLAT_024861 [Characodon lateralis]|uniref:Uncharacterized protein n=1 Tax=Characodon lateralis TaxID=208331 RepID=A0ABU7ECX1_9TELE|nr:hypothetical protein [Characodon lateralis]